MSEKSTSKKRQKKWLQVLQFFAAYLVAAWTFLQFVDWILNRYQISPYWVDILLWFFVGIIPSLVIYLYHRERINSKILRLREKIIFPLNLVLITVGLYFGFGTADLGSTTKSVNYTTEAGEQRSALITKEEFRTGFYIYDFKSKVADSTTTWLEFGISMLLHEDLLQNKNLSPEVAGIRNTTEKVKQASYFHDFYVDGEYEIINNEYTITTYIRNAKNAKIKAQEKVTGKDVLSLIDNISRFVIRTLDSKEFNNPNYLDLNIKEITSSNLKALEHFRNRQYENAVKEDSTFALAYLYGGKRNLNFNLSKFEDRVLADKAFRYRYKLPLQKQGEALILKYLAYDEFDKAEELVKLQLEVDPSDENYNGVLNKIYGKTKNLEAYTQLAFDAWEYKKSQNNGYNLLDASLIREDYDYILKQINALLLVQPNDDVLFSLKLLPQLLQGDINSATKTQEKIKLLHPNWQNLTKVHDLAIAYLKDNPVTKKALKKFEGVYRSNDNEQTQTFWINKNTLLRYVSNQGIGPLVLAGDYEIIAGHTLTGRTWNTEFLKNDLGQIYAFRQEQNDLKGSLITWYWKINKSILKAESLLENRQLDSAKVVYEEAIKLNPSHYYLKDALAHIVYVKDLDSITLANQLKEVVGTYGPRKFWVEAGKLFYKREMAENGQVFPTIELLPIAEDRYMNRTNLKYQYAFNYANGMVIDSYVYVYNLENQKWEKSELAVNTWRKD
ncbi:tetratricopeptide repeat protein [Muriicola sp. Z0-33]|uniref:tetratricopeptide repeat protein n=1 Tax=Muriicola sp. Z0-33 TaxID=2816957 RepID=UPI002238F6F7|nr:hypothetical protein [Muriicola sp. Z0-33]MCW5515434.1 hypothetical protein [Muriicola sp. Z0-33]